MDLPERTALKRWRCRQGWRGTRRQDKKIAPTPLARSASRAGPRLKQARLQAAGPVSVPGLSLRVL